MFSHDKRAGSAVCLADYGRIKRGAVVPESNELYADVEGWLAEGNQLLPFDGYPDTRPHKERVKSLKDRIDELRDEKIGEGLVYSFPDGLKGTIQLRRDKDIRNVQGLASSGQALVVSGVEAPRLEFRDAENVTHRLTGAQAVQMGLAVSSFVSIHYKAAWAHKDALDEGASPDSYDITAGWPE